MNKVPQKIQYTFRVEGSFHQLIENAFTVEDARIQLARRILLAEVGSTSEKEIRDYAHNQLRLVNMR